MQTRASSILRIERYEGLSLDMTPRLIFVEDVRYKPYASVPSQTHGHYELCLMVQGSAHYTVAGRSYLVEPGDLSITKPGELHRRVGADETEWRLFAVGVDRIVPDEIANLFLRTSIRHVKGCGALLTRYDQLLEEARQPRIAISYMVQALTTALLVESARRIERSDCGEGKSAYSEPVVTARLYIEMNVHHGLSVAEVAREVGLSESRLAHLFSREMSISISGYTRSILMQSSLRLLEEGRLNISQIADQLGFPSVHYFSSSFKRYWGYPPSQHRRTIAPSD